MDIHKPEFVSSQKKVEWKTHNLSARYEVLKRDIFFIIFFMKNYFSQFFHLLSFKFSWYSFCVFFFCVVIFLGGRTTWRLEWGIGKRKSFFNDKSNQVKIENKNNQRRSKPMRIFHNKWFLFIFKTHKLSLKLIHFDVARHSRDNKSFLSFFEIGRSEMKMRESK